jgi:hypothetical protein
VGKEKEDVEEGLKRQRWKKYKKATTDQRGASGSTNV